MNRLASETSPYLLQHADNPVHWYPWGDEALQRARAENRPILLSIGYSACHWCHVMAHESFADEDTAALMNALFINIKVDREERPDLDKIYQLAHSMLTSRPGGWPLTVFLSPDDHMPIFAGTYFPPEPRHGLPAFRQLLQHISEIHKTRQHDIAQQSASIRQALQQMAETGQQTAATLNSMPLDMVRRQIEQQFDSRAGGFSSAPKFPHPAIIEHALRHWGANRVSQQAGHEGDARLLHCALFSLERMAAGGLFDHLGGGFCRYSTDDQWMIPHFEKMLYDNGPLLWLYAQAWCISGDVRHRDTASDTADWVVREMQAAAGGYYSALDADSEGEEGKFYVWTPEEVQHALDDHSYPLFAHRFGLDRDANFEGRWHLHAYADYGELSQAFGMTETAVRKALQQARRQLFRQREQRVHPGLDDKILTAWNGLMIRGMATAGRLLGREDCIDSAAQAAGFIHDELWRQGRLLATSKDGKSHLNAYLDDYAFLLSGLLELLQARWDSRWLEWAEAIAAVLLEQFEDPDTGGFFFTSHDHEALIQRSKVYADEAIPAGNGMAAGALQLLGALTAEPRWLDAAERCLRAAWSSLEHSPIAHCSLLDALHDYLFPPKIIVIRGENKSLQHWHRLLTGRYTPRAHFFLVPTGIDLPDSLAQKTATGPVSTYVCEGMQCQPVITDSDQLSALIEASSARL